ncbi:MAG: flavodoxin family protein [Candidatus Undinarchaeales archaeon]|jgi:FMN-dependent NADH-azoreductase|nr:flavodoxin family protein [Candidatus Undinarchaeales archaeon]MDP7493760.1 flavodoxin family protein [Candidatus Undinarchaeales archaeon]
MKVVVVSGSMRPDDIVEKLIESCEMGLKAAGEPMDVEHVVLREEEMGFCTACLQCMEKDGLPLGVCSLHSDRMHDLLITMRDADRVVMATPLMMGTVTSLMKRFLERCAPLTFNTSRGRRARVKKHKGKMGAIILVHSFFPVLSRIVGKDRGARAMLKLILRAAGCEKVKILSIRIPRIKPYRVDRVRGRGFNLGLALAKPRMKKAQHGA